MKAPKIFAFSGPSNSGKTTLICKLCEFMDSKIAIIKHDPSNKANFDTRGKDSYKFFERANAVAVISPHKMTLQIKADSSKNIESSAENALFLRALEQFFGYDYVFIEGLKTLPYPRIVVARGAIESSYIPYASAFALDSSVGNADILPKDMVVLDLNNIAQIANFIAHFKE